MPLPALPFWLSISLMIPVILAAGFGGLWLIVVPLYAWGVMTFLDALVGINTENADPDYPDERLFWHKLITWVWVPLQMILIIGVLIAITRGGHLSTLEQYFVAVVLGVVTGTIGINFAHELIHQKSKWERRGGELLLISVLYGHFKSEHMLVHHRYVATPRDPVTAKYNENFWWFFPRVLWQCGVSAWKAEAAMLARKNKPWWDKSNPFWRYWGGALGFMAIAFAIGGLWGLFLFMTQAFIAILHLELVNYVEHYGLTRKYLGNGKYEPVRPRHSWNAAHRMTNYMLINLQRHSDHHYKPDRRFPLLQTYAQEEAPQLPYGYPLMVLMAAVPPIFRRVMNPRVRRWRADYYPEIVDWTPYTTMAKTSTQ